jgi:hypothetical protein
MRGLAVIGVALVLGACGSDAVARPGGSKVAGWPSGGVSDPPTSVRSTPLDAGPVATRPPAPTRLPYVTVPTTPAATAGATSSGPQTSAPGLSYPGPSSSGPAAGRVLYLGDSVLAAVGNDAAARARLLAGAAGTIDAEVCRRLVTTSCTVDGRTPDTAVEAIRRRAGEGFGIAVVEVGYNDPSIVGDLDVILRELAAIGVATVFWVTYNELGGRFAGHNAELAAAALRYAGRLRLIDWRGPSAGRAEWFASDGLHLSDAGARALAEVIATALRAVA